MRNLRRLQQNPNNFLNMAYLNMFEVPFNFRERVLEECNYSLPTFYRKLKDPYIFSNAEKQKMISIVDECIENLIEFVEPFRKKAN